MKRKLKKKKAYEDAETYEREEAREPEAEGNNNGEDKKREKPLRVEPVQSIVPVKEIYRGVIVTNDDRYVKILEVLPINFSLKSYEEQDNIIHLFASWLRISPAKLQFKVITRRADTSKIVSNVLLAAEHETNEKCRELTEDHVRFIRELSGQEALGRRFFLIFEYETTGSAMKRKHDKDDIINDIEETCRRIHTHLGQCGNEIVFPQNDDYFQAECLYMFYNRRTCDSEPLSDRVIRVTTDIMKMNGLTEGVDPYPDVPIADYVAPRGIDFSHSDYIVCDGVYLSILMVTRSGYPTAVVGGWMSSLIEAGDGVDVDIILRKEPRAQVKDKVALKLKLNRIKAVQRSDTDTDYEEIEGAIESAQFIKQALANGEDFYRMYTFITIAADTYEELLRRKDAVTDYLYSRDIVTKEIKMRLEDAFHVTAPLLQYRKELMIFAARNCTTFGAASLFPFASCELCDENGIVLGINRRYSSAVNIDIFNTKAYKNANISILGTSGSGKTFGSLVILLRMRYQGIQTFIISPDKAHEMQRVCAHIGGSYIRISPGAQSCINIMEIRPSVNPIAEFLDEIDRSEQESWLTQKTSQLLIFFHILIPDLTNEEEQLVDEAIIKTYNKYNITHDNDSIYEPGTKQIKTMPIIGDLYEVLRENEETRRVANILGRFVTGSAASFNRHTNVDLKNKFIVFDLEDLQGTMKAVGMFIVMDYLWTRIKENRTERKAIFIDEGWQLIGASSDSRAADFVYRIFKIIRGYGGSAIFATQDISDLFSFQDGKYGKAIISNSKIKIVLGLEQQEAKFVQDVLQLTKNEVRNIVNFNRGEALLCANNNKLPIYIRASKLEEELITTDPAQLRAIINQRKAEMEREAAMKAAAEEAQARAEQAAGKSNVHVEHPEPAPTAGTPRQGREQPGIPTPAPVPEAPCAEPISEDAILGIQAMEQLADTAIVRNQDGSIDAYEEALPTSEMADYDDFDAVSAAINGGEEEQEMALNRAGKLTGSVPADDMAAASDVEETVSSDAVPEGQKNENQRRRERRIHGVHPPADF